MKLFFGDVFQEHAILTQEESHHFTKVLRGKLNDIIYVTNGTGTLIKGKATDVHAKEVTVSIDEKFDEFERKNYRLHMVVAPTKNMDRLEFFLEKATEIGLDEITFIQSFHSERKALKIERIEKIIQAATKQSLKAYFPIINPLVKFTDFLEAQKTNSADKFIAHCNQTIDRIPLKEQLRSSTGDVVILIGPEGDFSVEEVQLAEKKGFKGISLGHQRFRTETAALQAVFATDWELGEK